MKQKKKKDIKPQGGKVSKELTRSLKDGQQIADDILKALGF